MAQSAPDLGSHSPPGFNSWCWLQISSWSIAPSGQPSLWTNDHCWPFLGWGLGPRCNDEPAGRAPEEGTWPERGFRPLLSPWITGCCPILFRGGSQPQDNRVDAIVWSFEAFQTYHTATQDEALIRPWRRIWAMPPIAPWPNKPWAFSAIRVLQSSPVLCRRLAAETSNMINP